MQGCVESQRAASRARSSEPTPAPAIWKRKRRRVTPASGVEDEALRAARQALEADPNVKAMKDMFGATLNGDSVQIVDKQ